MKIVVVGATGLESAKKRERLRKNGHEVVPASRRSGVSAITGEGTYEGMPECKEIHMVSRQIQTLVIGTLLPALIGFCQGGAFAAGEKASTSPQKPITKPIKQARLLSSEAKISIKKAEKIALKEAPGCTDEIELERNDDGTVAYCVEILRDDKEVEVTVDAKTGHILKTKEKQVEHEDKHPDAESSKTN